VYSARFAAPTTGFQRSSELAFSLRVWHQPGRTACNPTPMQIAMKRFRHAVRRLSRYTTLNSFSNRFSTVPPRDSHLIGVTTAVLLDRVNLDAVARTRIQSKGVERCSLSGCNLHTRHQQVAMPGLSDRNRQDPRARPEARDGRTSRRFTPCFRVGFASLGKSKKPARVIRVLAGAAGKE